MIEKLEDKRNIFCDSQVMSKINELVDEVNYLQGLLKQGGGNIRREE
tara:strand:- start:9260 stop:9400 length:141 start_codon:yes stop_codon:yes gene_type:complete